MTSSLQASAHDLVGWCLLAGATLAATLVVMHRALIRRAWMRAEDPRSMGALRIAFGACFLIGALEVVTDANWFFSDEGMFLTAGARQRFAGEALTGYIEGQGFEDTAALWAYLTSGRATLLHFWDSPFVVWTHVFGLLAALLGFTVGLWTRLCGWLGLLLFVMLLGRNNAFAAGDQIYTSGMFLLCMSRCGHAYSLDNWLRCRALRQRRELSETSGPGGGAGVAPSASHPRGLAAHYRRIPAWPRMLIIAQLAVIYGVNGINKSGELWWDGTAVFYSMQHHAFARFDSRPLWVAVGPTAVWWVTQFVHFWELLFPLMVVGMTLRFAARERLPPPPGARFVWLALGVLAIAFAWLAAPFDLDGQVDAVTTARWWRLGVGSALLGILWFGYPRVRSGSLELRWRGDRTVRIDRRLLSSTALGRWPWLGFGLLFHGGLVVLMNLGGFQLATMALYIACFDGSSVAGALRRCRLSREIPAEDPSLPHLHHDNVALSWQALASVLALSVGGAIALAVGASPTLWRLALALGAAVAILSAPRASLAPSNSGASGPWAYGPLGRTLAGGLCAVHLTAIFVAVLPPRPALAKFRSEARTRVSTWLAVTGATQAWSMFAPSPPRMVGQINTVVIDAEGSEHDLRTGLYLPEHLQKFELWPERRRKIEVLLLGKRPELAQWQARAVCRRFALEHGGATPREARLSRQLAPIESPEDPVVEGGPSARFAASARPSEVVLTVDCRREPHAQLPDDIRARHGLPPLAVPFQPLPLSTADRPAIRAEQAASWSDARWFTLLLLVAALVRQHRSRRAGG